MPTVKTLSVSLPASTLALSNVSLACSTFQHVVQEHNTPKGEAALAFARQCCRIVRQHGITSPVPTAEPAGDKLNTLLPLIETFRALEETPSPPQDALVAQAEGIIDTALRLFGRSLLLSVHPPQKSNHPHNHSAEEHHHYAPAPHPV